MFIRNVMFIFVNVLVSCNCMEQAFASFPRLGHRLGYKQGADKLGSSYIIRVGAGLAGHSTRFKKLTFTNQRLALLPVKVYTIK